MVVLFAMFGVVALSKAVRDKIEGYRVSAFLRFIFAVGIPTVALVLMLIFLTFLFLPRVGLHFHLFGSCVCDGGAEKIFRPLLRSTCWRIAPFRGQVAYG